MFRHRYAPLVAAVVLAVFAGPLPATAGIPPDPPSTRAIQPVTPLEVALYDRTAGRMLPLHAHRGEFHVVGEPGHVYEIRLRNAGDGRVLAVTSVDGVNVVTGRTAAPTTSA